MADGKHEASVEPATITFLDEQGNPKPAPIQPNKAFWRTALQVGPAAAFALLVILPPVLQDILDNFGRQLPPDIYAALVSIVAGLTLISAIAARVMANAKVIAWFRQYAPFFAPEKK